MCVCVTFLDDNFSYSFSLNVLFILDEKSFGSVGGRVSNYFVVEVVRENEDSFVTARTLRPLSFIIIIL